MLQARAHLFLENRATVTTAGKLNWPLGKQGRDKSEKMYLTDIARLTVRFSVFQ